MNILAIDTSGPVCSTAILRDSVLCYESRSVNRLTHSRSLMPMVDEALHISGTRLEDINLIAAVTGPGSFTGVRIAVAAAQGMAQALHIKCVAVDALEAMALSVISPGIHVCPIRDARVQQVYGAAFLDGIRVMEDVAIKIDQFIDEISTLAGSLMFLGDGVPLHRRIIGETLGSRAIFAPAHLLLPGAGAAARIAQGHSDDSVDPENLKPTYLRAPQAERMMKERNA